MTYQFDRLLSSDEGIMTRYMHSDALGSIDTITDNLAEVVDRRSYDAWGKLRDFDWRAGETTTALSYQTELPFTNKAYTGHENIQEVDLIHMNGRVYDATLARFNSSDPYIQAGGRSQSYNRYAYVINNPMKYTDPSGYIFKSFGKALYHQRIKPAMSQNYKTMATVVIAVVTTKICGACSKQWWSAAAVGGAAGAANAAINGGNVFRGAITGAISGAVFQQIGSSGWNDGALVAAHSIAGGTISVIQGGKFGHGFISAGLAKSVSLNMNFSNREFHHILGRTTISAIVGGTASVIGGGKFSNGAFTAAMAHLFNADSDNQSSENDTSESLELSLDETQTKNVLEYFFNDTPRYITDRHIDYAEKLLIEGFEKSRLMGAVDRIFALIGPSGLTARSINDVMMNGATDLVTGGSSSWNLLINGSSIENPQIYNSVRLGIAWKHRRVYDALYSGKNL